MSDAAAPDDLSPARLGFAGDPEQGWRAALRGRDWHFRPLRSLADLAPVDDLQRLVMGVSDYDLMPANGLVVVRETGGEVIGAFPSEGGDLAGFVIGWGGWVDGLPRILSDMLAVDPAHRNAGLGAALKRLQAGHARTAGFREVVWTVDPLRAANARLNFEKLGATARHYETDRYGGYGAGLYGAMPTDRLHVSWRIDGARARGRLLGLEPPTAAAEVAGVATFARGMAAARALVAIPADIDALLRAEPAAALVWRHRVRDALLAAFAEGFTITGFAAGPEVAESGAALVLTRE